MKSRKAIRNILEFQGYKLNEEKKETQKKLSEGEDKCV
jgi:hypothetical protein